MKQRQKYISHGRVQGVGYRNFVCVTARRLGLSGQVQNLLDGTVETFAEGDDVKLAQLVEALQKGPPFARVTQVIVSQVLDSDPVYRQHIDESSFNIVA